jgi:hypothetical protein
MTVVYDECRRRAEVDEAQCSRPEYNLYEWEVFISLFEMSLSRR